MFCVFEEGSLRIPKRQAAKTLQLIPLPKSQLLLLASDSTLTHYQLGKISILGHIKLPSLPRRMIAISPQSVVLLLPQEKALFQVSLRNYELKSIFKFDTNSHIIGLQGRLAEKEWLSTIQPVAFLLSKSFFFRQERREERKVRVRWFKKDNDKWEWKSKDIPSSCSVVAKFDQDSCIAIYKQQISNNGIFCSNLIDENTEEELVLQADAFSSFSIVKELKKLNIDTIIVAVNSRQPEILIFREKVLSNNIAFRTNLLNLIQLYPCLISLNFAENESCKERLELRGQQLNLMDCIQGNFSQVVSSSDGQWTALYERETTPSDWITLKPIQVIKKEHLYMHLLTKKYESTMGTSINSMIVSLLQN